MDNLQQYYARRASEYERIYAKPERQQDLAALKKRLRHVYSGRKVLELACGTGYWTEEIASRAQHVIALDVNDGVLQIARAKPIAAGKVEFRVGDAYRPPASPQCDALFAGHWWSHVPLSGLDAFLRTAVQSVAPGALIGFMDNRYVEGSSTALSRKDAEGNTYQTRRLDDGSSHEVLKNFPGEEELIKRASLHGWGAHVELFQYFWLLSFWAPK